MDPVHVYWLMVATVALPCALFSIASRLVVMVFCGALLGLWAGFPIERVYLALHAFAFGAGLFACKTRPGRMACLLFLPLAIIDRQTIIGNLSHDQWWCAVYWLAVLQITMLPFTVERSAIAQLWGKRMGGRGDDTRLNMAA